MVTQLENEIISPSMPEPAQLPQTLQPLERLAWNYWWSWAPDGIAVFRDLDPELWEHCELNPRALLTRVPELRLAEMATDPIFAFRVQRLAERFDSYIADNRSSGR